MIGREDIDFLAKKLGYGDMNALQEERKAEARARAEAKRAEEERARMEEARRYQEAIDREIARVAPVIRTGGYVPGVDHYVHPDVPWEHFLYYRRRLAEVL